jgi:ABC-type Na+ efflux pump permease subunit
LLLESVPKPRRPFKAVALSFASAKLLFTTWARQQRIAPEQTFFSNVAVTALPIADRELLVYARQSVTYRGRLTVAIVTFLFGGGFALLFSNIGMMGAGQLLHTLATYIMIYCMVAGSQATSDSISKEKREGTLGLLFLTHLTPFDIAGGKLVSSVLLTFYGFMASFPILSLVLLTGGVEGGSIFRLSLASLNTLFVSATIGLFASTLSRENKASRIATGFVIVLFWLGIPGLSALGQFRHWPDWATIPLTCLSLSKPIQNALSGPMPSVQIYYWLPLLCTHVLGWVLLAISTWVLPRSWQEKGAGKKGLTFGQRWQQWCYGKDKKRLRHRARLLNRNPFFWLAARNRLKPLLPATIFFLVLGLYIFVSYMNDGLGIFAFIPFILVSTFVQAILSLSEASTRLLQDHEQGTLELLLSTPLTVKEIIRGQLMACWRQYKSIYATQMLLSVLLFFGIFTGGAQKVSGMFGWAVMFGLAWLIFYPLEMIALIYLGMWGVVVSKNVKLASRASMGRGIFLPGVLWSLLLLALWLAVLHWNLPYTIPMQIMAPLACVLFIGNAIFWIFHVHRNFEVKLREFAMRRYTPEEKKSFWSALFSRRSPLPPPIVSAVAAQ